MKYESAQMSTKLFFLKALSLFEMIFYEFFNSQNSLKTL